MPVKIFTFLLLFLSVHAPTWAQMPSPMREESVFVEKWATPELLEQLRKGGFVLYVRHGYTNNAMPDQLQINLADCSTQRLLSEPGRKLMREVGESIRQARIPVDEVFASPMCRTKESAELLMPGKAYTVSEPLMYWTTMSTAEKAPRLEALKKLLSSRVAPGSNRLLVAHAPNLYDLIGFFVKPEGTVVIFAHGGKDGYEYVASIHPGMWAGLLK